MAGWDEMRVSQDEHRRAETRHAVSMATMLG
jgi:hypothetical protein